MRGPPRRKGRLSGGPLLLGSGFCGLRLRLQAVQEGGGAFGMGGGGEDRPLVVLQHTQPRFDIAGMIRAQFQCQAKIGAEKRASKFGNQFLRRVSFISPAFAAKLTGKALLVFRGMTVMPISA